MRQQLSLGEHFWRGNAHAVGGVVAGWGNADRGYALDLDRVEDGRSGGCSLADCDAKESPASAGLFLRPVKPYGAALWACPPQKRSSAWSSALLRWRRSPAS
jgi:hypothetical protein